MDNVLTSVANPVIAFIVVSLAGHAFIRIRKGKPAEAAKWCDLVSALVGGVSIVVAVFAFQDRLDGLRRHNEMAETQIRLESLRQETDLHLQFDCGARLDFEGAVMEVPGQIAGSPRVCRWIQRVGWAVLAGGSALDARLSQAASHLPETQGDADVRAVEAIRDKVRLWRESLAQGRVGESGALESLLNRIGFLQWLPELVAAALALKLCKLLYDIGATRRLFRLGPVTEGRATRPDAD